MEHDVTTNDLASVEARLERKHFGAPDAGRHAGRYDADEDIYLAQIEILGRKD